MRRTLTTLLAFCIPYVLLSLPSASLSQQTSSVPQPAVGPIAYETATLPADRVQAWEMLRAATGLGDDTLQPWYLRAHYKTYDAYGKPKNDGTLEYVRFGPQRWRFTFTEGTTFFSRWQTEKGVYSPKGQLAYLPYPTSIILGQFLHPLGSNEADKLVPTLFEKTKIGNTPLSCFRSDQSRQPDLNPRADLKRACTVPDRPLLLLRQGDYDVFYESSAAFQHRIVAKTILVRLGSDDVVDIYLNLLRTANSEDMKTLEPPLDAEFQPKAPQVLSSSVLAGHIVRKSAPVYPFAAKQKRSQGTVRLAALIGIDGTVKHLEVMHSPDVALTNAAEDAVRHWTYTPYLVDGKPVEVNTVVNVTFILGG